MTKDEYIDRMRSALDCQYHWAGELGDEYLDGDDEVRQQYVKDRQEAMELMRVDHSALV